ncbi:gluconeogenesis factor YvcK family protein [Nocardia cyriacigeorgica]|uniref:gluconeogenesis factor YvcK family protein n=1 Tax=Nocardia cyriacigeorgica TaxID=135487 RepID=UPI0013D33BA5|nr:uridine diphosphate-N-acetylglucosamine-binding protein YvcK [Nocardia cyriacigeorgica]MBF6435758.1 uridine diphosphate-N-acetylglucosamine-binding protein YvcK [Nocardia cyriacigeorgica]MBF6454163.1 uridine diphosphate-N-acetylglucosamine-binding protein YvcK [Nocardia cyriacigeorgica]MBF6477605.1 uridine diphosphate-N-acetylglucosamine-binding protein YvcK [Nocardia cyriacigeorgica]MBF6552057.1 uridine diphosphate-N-acetylglucosamine-binding protein YvcK [Nocardia cyriacigeorgica]NEW29544
MTGWDANPAIVALGGGHGLYATLTAVRRLTTRISAVVTVADDGGSSGRLRAELGVPPPGDLRMALAALAADADGVWTRTVQHRFGGTGALAGHSVGNLILAGLTEVLGDPVAALDQVAALLGVTGRVLPMSPIALDIEADVSGLEADPRVSRCIRGQVAVATTPGKVRRVRLIPSDPPASPEATSAIEHADVVVLGPGSWFTSVIPHVLVPELHDALVYTRARKVLVLNLAAEPGETAGFSAERHLHVLSQHAPDFAVDDVLVDSGCVPEGREREHVARAAEQLRARVVFSDVADAGTDRHHPGKLAAALDRLIREPRPTMSGLRVEGRHMGQDVRSGLGGKERVSWR